MPGECAECGRLREGLHDLELNAWNFHKWVAEYEESPPTLATEVIVELIAQICALLDGRRHEAGP